MMGKRSLLVGVLGASLIAAGSTIVMFSTRTAHTPQVKTVQNQHLSDISVGAVPLRVNAMSSLRDAWDNELADWWSSGKPSLTPQIDSAGHKNPLPLGCQQGPERGVDNYPKGYYPLGCFIVEAWERPMGAPDTEWFRKPLSLGEETIISLTGPVEEKGMVGATLTSSDSCKGCDITPHQRHIVISRRDWDSIRTMVTDIITPKPLPQLPAPQKPSPRK